MYGGRTRRSKLRHPWLRFPRRLRSLSATSCCRFLKNAAHCSPFLGPLTTFRVLPSLKKGMLNKKRASFIRKRVFFCCFQRGQDSNLRPPGYEGDLGYSLQPHLVLLCFRLLEFYRFWVIFASFYYITLQKTIGDFKICSILLLNILTSWQLPRRSIRLFLIQIFQFIKNQLFFVSLINSFIT